MTKKLIPLPDLGSHMSASAANTRTLDSMMYEMDPFGVLPWSFGHWLRHAHGTPHASSYLSHDDQVTLLFGNGGKLFGKLAVELAHRSRVLVMLTAAGLDLSKPLAKARAYFGKVTALTIDMDKPTEIRDAFDRVLSRYGKITAVVDLCPCSDNPAQAHDLGRSIAILDNARECMMQQGYGNVVGVCALGEHAASIEVSAPSLAEQLWRACTLNAKHAGLEVNQVHSPAMAVSRWPWSRGRRRCTAIAVRVAQLATQQRA